jgi:hypothetical protein
MSGPAFHCRTHSVYYSLLALELPLLSHSLKLRLVVEDDHIHQHGAEGTRPEVCGGGLSPEANERGQQDRCAGEIPQQYPDPNW